jgi:hypothetical protein
MVPSKMGWGVAGGSYYDLLGAGIGVPVLALTNKEIDANVMWEAIFMLPVYKFILCD